MRKLSDLNDTLLENMLKLIAAGSISYGIFLIAVVFKYPKIAPELLTPASIFLSGGLISLAIQTSSIRNR